MGAWSVSENGLIYEMEYANGFKRAIRTSQIVKANTYTGTDYSSSQNPNLVLAKIVATIKSFTAGVSTIDFTPDGSNGWDVSVLLEPISFQNVPNNSPLDSTHFDIEFWSGGVSTIIYDSDISADATENTGANGAGVYFIKVTYNFSDGTAFVVYSYYLVDATDTVLKSVAINGIAVNSVNGLVMNVTLNVVQTNCSFGFLVIGLKADNSSYYIGNTIDGAITLEPSTKYLIFTPDFDSSFTNDYDGDPILTQTIIIS